MGKPAYPNATRLLITADNGGSNGARVKLWKVELQAFANETGLEIQVSHFPPGTSKWNKIDQDCHVLTTARQKRLLASSGSPCHPSTDPPPSQRPMTGSQGNEVLGFPGQRTHQVETGMPRALE